MFEPSFTVTFATYTAPQERSWTSTWQGPSTRLPSTGKELPLMPQRYQKWEVESKRRDHRSWRTEETGRSCWRFLCHGCQDEWTFSARRSVFYIISTISLAEKVNLNPTSLYLLDWLYCLPFSVAQKVTPTIVGNIWTYLIMFSIDIPIHSKS